MRNLNKLGLLVGVGGMSALVFALTGCSDDPAAPGTTGGTSGASAGGGAAGTPSMGGSMSGSGGGGMSGGGAGSGGGGAGGGGAGGGAGGGGAGGGGAGGGAGGGGAGGGGAGGGGNASPACQMLCEGADSIVTVCAAVAEVPASLKATPSCLERCAEADEGDIACWQTHTTNYKTMMGDHCLHAAGMTPCDAWPPE
jgi:hypothetical protein